MDDRKLRRIEGRAEAEALLGAWEASGEGVKAWCRSQGVNWYSLNAYLGWTKRTRPPAKQLPALVELALPVEAGRARSAPVYRVDVDGLVLEVGEPFDDEAVRRLVRVLASC